MLGRYEVPGCCSAARAGRQPGPDCSGGGSMGRRRAKRLEARRVREEITEEVSPLRKWLAPWDLPDCIHGCAGPRDWWEPCAERCTYTCHDPAFSEHPG